MTSKKRVTIYIDEVVWKLGKEAAWELRLSFSVWLEEAIQEKINLKQGHLLVGGSKPISEVENMPPIPDTGNQKLDVSDVAMAETKIPKKTAADRIREKLNGNQERQYSKAEEVTSVDQAPEAGKADEGMVAQISESDEALLKKSQANGQAKLDASRKGRKIKSEKIADVKSLTGFSGPRPKGAK